MTTAMNAQQQCVTCNKSGGILTCNGCEQTFCVKHVIEHRQELANQLDDIIQEHDLVQQELGRSSDEHMLLEKINQWEKESITKIQVAAEAARADLRVMIERSKKQLLQTCHDVAVNIRSSREADDFSENDLKRWIQLLENLKLDIVSSSSIQLIEDERSAIHLITIREKETKNTDLKSSERDIISKPSSSSTTQERFSKVIGDARLADEGFLVKYSTDSNHSLAFVLGQQYYSKDRQTLRFRIENTGVPYNIFFGCISLKTTRSEVHFDSSSAVGWFGYNEVWQHGSVNRQSKEHGYKSDEIAINDILHLTFDCQQRQIELFHERTNKRHTLPVNIDNASFPWQLLIVLTTWGDCVRILL